MSSWHTALHVLHLYALLDAIATEASLLVYDAVVAVVSRDICCFSDLLAVISRSEVTAATVTEESDYRAVTGLASH